ncbi:MAG: alpha/beta fold hydrolase, partial [Pseudomonadota bacterium]
MKLANLLIILIYFSGISMVQGATLSQLNLWPDSSSNPPGDMISAIVYLYPGESKAEVQIRPLLISGKNEEIINKIKVASGVKDRRNQDEKGYLLIRYPLQRQAGADSTGMVFKEIKLPMAYALLNLGVGTYQLAYEIRLLVEGRVDFQDTTRSTMVKVTKKTRDWMNQQTLRDDPLEKKSLEATFIDKNGKIQYKKIEKPARFQSIWSKTVEAQIPGEYIRYEKGQEPPPADVPMAPSSDLERIPLGQDGQPAFERMGIQASIEMKEPMEQYLQDLKNKPWVPTQQKMINFATNRNVVQDTSDLKRYGNELSPKISYGQSMVNIPIAGHTRGKMETPSWWNRQDVNKYFSVEKLQVVAREVFLNHTAKPLGEKKQDILLFVHGYNNTFEFGQLRLAQLVHDIRFAGSAVLFSWPSAGKDTAYKEDEQKAEASYSALAQVLKDLIEQSRKGADLQKIGKIHIIAHSMGNRVLLRALHELRNTIPKGLKPFGHIVLAAPDIGVDQFVAWFPTASRAADSVSLYFCEEDKALSASRLVHQDRRVGQGPVFTEGLENIDAARVNTSFLGHDYFVSRSELLIDLELLMVNNF